MSLDDRSKQSLLVLARSAVEVALGAARDLRVIETAVLAQRRGAFVTLTRAGTLRGCIGRVEPDAPLGTMIPDVARLAALDDPRFPPATAAELALIRFEISLLSVPAPLGDPTAVVVGRDGLIVSGRGRRGLLLPQVAVEYEWTAEEFLAQTCVKAGLPPGAWRDASVRFLSFQAEVFGE